MILKGNQRGGGPAIGCPPAADENEHVEFHELRGFAAEELSGALDEAHAISRGTRARQYLFSLSLNPPRDAEVGIEAFEAAIETIEERLGLSADRAPSFSTRRTAAAMPMRCGRASMPAR